MRISTLQIYQQGIEAFGKQQTKLSHLQQQISSGVRITKPSDDPAASARVLQLEQSVELNLQYNINVTLAQNRLNTEETALAAIENTYFRLKELAVQANGALSDPTALGSIRAEVKERYEELLFLANTKDNSGQYLFAGYQNNNPPFTKALNGSMEYVIFNGDQGQRSLQISETRQIAVDDSGSSVFMQVPSKYGLNTSVNPVNGGSGVIGPAMVTDPLTYKPNEADESSSIPQGPKGPYTITFTNNPLNTPPITYDVVDTGTGATLVSGATYDDGGKIEFDGITTSITGTPADGDVFSVNEGQYRDIFQTLQAFMDALGAPLSNASRVESIDEVQKDMKAFFDNVLDVRTSIGGRLNALETQYDDNLAFITTTKQTIGTLRDTDLAEAISQLTIEQTTLDAAQAVFARISNSSLFNFLR
jgi:flagellar hook-associated protein 3 FlgL